MAIWASAAWGREALGVGVETSKRLDLSVKAQLVGVYMNASAVERSVCRCVCVGVCNGVHGYRSARAKNIFEVPHCP